MPSDTASDTASDRGQPPARSFESDSLEAIEGYLAATYARIQITSRDPSPRLTITRKSFGPLWPDRHRFGFTFDFEIEPTGVLGLAMVRSGSMPHYRTDGLEDSWGAGDIVLTAQPDRPVTGRLSHMSFSFVTIPPTLLDQVAATAPRRRPEPVRLLGHRPVSPVATLQLGRTITYLRRLPGVPESKDEPILASSASQLLAAAILATFPSNAVFDPTIEERHDASAKTLRRSIEYIEENAHQDITISDIAEAVPVSIRAVQHAFRQRLDTTPTAYLRQVRMARARTDLLLADPAGGDTVATIAARWGFDHGGRFAVAYRGRYGEVPSATLRRQP